jgi:ElaB/YqjD/DUF883 family membrane-anchored ribosome-binding protein
MESNLGHNSLEKHDIKSNLADASSKIKEGVVDLVGESKYAASRGQEMMSKSIHEGIDVVSKSNQIISAIGYTVKEKPMKSIAIAAGVGLLLGAVLQRSRC